MQPLRANRCHKFRYDDGDYVVAVFVVDAIDVSQNRVGQVSEVVVKSFKFDGHAVFCPVIDEFRFFLWRTNDRKGEKPVRSQTLGVFNGLQHTFVN